MNKYKYILRHVLNEEEEFNVYEPIEMREVLMYKKEILNFMRGPMIYRGLKSYEMQPSYYYKADARNYDANPRVSSGGGTRNIYNLLLSNLPSWKAYPKRSESFICSFSEKDAKIYGNLYIAVPLDNQGIGICPTNDIWTSFQKGLDQNVPGTYSIEDLVDGLGGLLRPNSGSNAKYEDYPTLVKRIHDLDETFKSSTKDEMLNVANLNSSRRIHFFAKRLVEAWYSRIHDGDELLLSILEDTFDPTLNGFVLTNHNDLSASRYTDASRECWFTGRALFVSLLHWYRLIETVTGVKNKDE